MPFDTALSGIRAASNDLSITGNNIANASTTGFKSSRAEFGDVYATSVLGAGSNPIGSGLRLQDVAQQFSQGSVAFTENELDLAINGNGFFVVRQDGEQFYTRAGTFGLDKDGFIVANNGARLQGFQADDQGNIAGLQSDVSIQTSNLAPRSTTGVSSELNLNSTAPVLQSTGRAFSTEGNAIGVTRVGLEDATYTTVPDPATATGFGLPLGTNFATDSITFDVQMTASSGNNGLVSINLNSASGVPATINSFNDLRTLAGVINAQINSPVAPQTAIDVMAEAIDMGGGQYRLQFTSIQEGEGSQIQLTNGSDGTAANQAAASDLGLPVGAAVSTSIPGIAAVTNGYPQQSIDILDEDGSVVTYTAAAGSSAATVASEMNALAGITATASTDVRLIAADSNVDSDMIFNINGVNLSGATLADLGDAINQLSDSTLPGISAEIDTATGDLLIHSAVGDDITVNIDGLDGHSVSVLGNPNAPAETLEVDTDGTLNNANAIVADGNSIIVGGTIDLVVAEGFDVANPTPPSVGMFGPITDATFTNVTLNEFDPNDQATYNSATSMNIYDSMGNAHVLTQYFVRQEYDPNDPTTSPNHWVMYVQVDGENVGDPDTTLAPPLNTVPTMASYNVYFNEDGSLNNLLTDDMLISNWTPLDENGNPNGSLGPQNVLAGGNTNIQDPITSSNFVIDLDGTTQFGAAFSVDDVDQNGFTTGRLSGLNIDESGIIFARFTNGESQVLGQIALADFANNQGLQPVGDTMWAENFESGPPNIGTPRSGALGAIQAGALEESNVDLSEELVALIIAQRNFQASAKTIETADQVTQTIINLR